MGKKLLKDKQLQERLFQTFLDMHDLEGANFQETPRRVAAMWQTFLKVEKPVLRAFPTDNNSMVIVDRFSRWSFCPHHLLPVKYTFKIGYIPQGRSLGLSKFPRLAEWVLSRLPIQEDIPELIINEIQPIIKPLGIGCQVEGYHLCSVVRGVKCEDIRFVTTALKGVLLHSPASQHEFLTT